MYLNESTADIIFTRVRTVKICIGNPDFPTLIRKKVEKVAPEEFFSSPSKEKVAFMQTCMGYHRFNVIRHVNCSLVTLKHERCNACTLYRKVLFAMVSKQKRPCGDKDKSKVNVRYQSRDRYQYRDELLIKLKMLEKDRKCLYAKILG